MGGPRILPFRFRAVEPAPPLVTTGEKFGLYPVADDVIVSKPLFILILTLLDSGEEEDRAGLAQWMREAFAAPFG